jgi:integrase
MSVYQLPSGRWRSQIHDPRVGHNISVSKILGPPSTFPTKREAKRAREKARALLAGPRSTVTVAQFRQRWISDPLFARPKESTRIHNEERTRAFADKYGSVPMSQVSDETVAEWLRGGKRNGSVPALRAMFNDAASAKGGRLVERNPFAKLGLKKGKGNAEVQPANEGQVWALINKARELAGLDFAMWLQVAAFSGLRPGEMDALRPNALDFDRNRIHVREQFNAKTRTFTLPKNGQVREAPMTGPAREALMAVPLDREFVFVNLRQHHWTPGSRAYHWHAVRAAAGWDKSLYLATRHHAGWYMRNVLGLDSEDVAIALGHTDGGELVRRLYGHLDKNLALDRVAMAYEQRANVRPLDAYRKETG